MAKLNCVNDEHSWVYSPDLRVWPHKHQWVLKLWWRNKDDNYCGAEEYQCIKCGKVKRI